MVNAVRYDITRSSPNHSRVDCRFPPISLHSTRKYNGSSRFCQVSEIQFIFLLVVDTALQYRSSAVHSLVWWESSDKHRIIFIKNILRKKYCCWDDLHPVAYLGWTDKSGGGGYRGVWGVWTPQTDGRYGTPHRRTFNKIDLGKVVLWGTLYKLNKLWLKSLFLRQELWKAQY